MGGSEEMAAKRGNNKQGSSQASEDGAVVRRVLAGEVNAFADLLKKYTPLVAAIVNRHIPARDVEETAQTVMIKAYQSLAGFDPDSHFEKWLSTIAVRTCTDYWRKAYRNRELPLCALSDRHREWLEDAGTGGSDDVFDRTVHRREAKEVLEWALGRLSPEDRMVMELVYLEERSGKEAAALLGWSVANVKVRSFRARKKLRKLLLNPPRDE